MALKQNVFWWIEGKDGKLVQFNRLITCSKITECGCPHLHSHQGEVHQYCLPGEKPVKVRLVKVEE